jgi:hypothetical protein
LAEKTKGIFSKILHVLLASIITIILGLIFFMIFLWIVKTGSSLLGLGEPTADGAITAASILALATIVSAAISGS